MITEFTMLEPGWAEAQGKSLQAVQQNFEAPSASIENHANGAEEVAAVLAGKFRLTSESDIYELQAGEAVLIPPNAPRSWELLSATGTLYRVWPK